MSQLSTHSQQIIALHRRYRKAISHRFFLLSRLAENEMAEIIFHSHALQGGKFSHKKISEILQGKHSKRAVFQNEITEIENLKSTLESLEDSAHHQELTLGTIKSLHQNLLQNIDDKTAGFFRKNKQRARIKTDVQDYTGPAPNKISPLLEEALIDYYCSPHDGIVKRLARLHLAFAHARPFVDGNGRAARNALNYLLIREGFPTIIIRKQDQRKYNEAFKEFNKKRLTKKMEEIIASALINSLHKRLAYLDDKKIVTLTDYAKSKKSSLSALLNKAKRHTIEAFLENDIWMIGVAQKKAQKSKS